MDQDVDADALSFETSFEVRKEEVEGWLNMGEIGKIEMRSFALRPEVRGDLLHIEFFFDQMKREFGIDERE